MEGGEDAENLAVDENSCGYEVAVLRRYVREEHEAAAAVGLFAHEVFSLLELLDVFARKGDGLRAGKGAVFGL